ncbi:MAG: FtsL-like putative cell division protein [Bacteroidales bacterium]|nr:FtsL-like putative cell division protein [Bacteroidales bacterium]
MVKENLKYQDKVEGMNGSSTPRNPPGEDNPGFSVSGPVTAHVKASRRVSKSRKAVQEFLGGDYLSKEWVTGNLTYILYVALLAMIYIANTYYTEKKFKAIDRTKNQLKELRYEYITTKSILMFQGRQSMISKRAVMQGLKEVKMPPYKILYSGESLHSEPGMK